MDFSKRNFLRYAGIAAAASAAPLVGCQSKKMETPAIADPFADLHSMVEGVAPITVQERMTRIEKAQRLMVENEIDAIYLDAGTSMEYFTGVRWGQSERMLAVVIPADGELKYISPGFEEARLRELMSIGSDVRVWQEHESPYERVAEILDEFGAATGKVAMEERVRFFLYDGIRRERPQAEYVSADPITVPCRIFKSPDEIRLMQKASDITIACYKASIPRLEAGMTPQDFINLSAQAMTRLGGPGGRLWCSFAEATAFPHGSSEPQYLKEGDMVLMDGGCGVHGYRADISRTTVFGEPTARQTEIWNLEKAAQRAGFDAARLGAPCENVDIAARQVLLDAGFGPGYDVPGLPHRTGHGIGMDGHEWGNMVLGNKHPLGVGMCFSVEPMIAIYGEFGVRLEDCAHMTEDGARWFSEPSVAVDQPV